MASPYEPNPKRFWRIFIISMIFMVFMAILIIQRKMEKERNRAPKQPTVKLHHDESIYIPRTGFTVCWNGQGPIRPV